MELEAQTWSPRQIAAPTAKQALQLRASEIVGGFVFYAVLSLIILAAVPYGTVDPWWESRFEGAVFVLAGLWIVQGLLAGSWHLNSYSLLAPIVALAAFAYFQTMPIGPAPEWTIVEGKTWWSVSADPFETLRFVIKIVSIMLVGVLLSSYTSDRRRLGIVIHTVMAIGVLSALFGIVRQGAQTTETGFLLAYLVSGEGYGQFVNSNHFAFMMEMCLGLTLGLVVGGGVRADRVLIYLAALIPMWVALILSNSRGGILASLSQIFFIALFFSAVRTKSIEKQSKKLPHLLLRMSQTFVGRALLVVCLSVAVAIGIIWIGGTPLVERLEKLQRETGTEHATHESVRRVDIWRSTWQLIKDNPVVGVGFGAYWVAIPQYHSASGKETPQEAHNDYLELIASGGVIGLALAVFFVFALVRRALHQLHAENSFRRSACFGALAGLFGVSVHSFVDFGLHVTANAVVFAALVIIATIKLPAEPTDASDDSTGLQLRKR